MSNPTRYTIDYEGDEGGDLSLLPHEDKEGELVYFEDAEEWMEEERRKAAKSAIDWMKYKVKQQMYEPEEEESDYQAGYADCLEEMLGELDDLEQSRDLCRFEEES